MNVLMWLNSHNIIMEFLKFRLNHTAEGLCKDIISSKKRRKQKCIQAKDK